MRQRKWQRLRYSGSKCETGEIRVSGGFWSRLSDVQNKKYSVITSMLIGQLAFACNTQTMITDPENSTYKGKDMQLEEGEMEITGTRSLSTLEGREWRLTRFNQEQPLSANVEVTLSFSDGRFSGKSACNRYSVQVSESDEPGGIGIGRSAGTRMACPEPLMEIENRYLATLSQVTSFSFNSESLTLSGVQKDGSRFSMVFSPAETKSK